MPHDYELKAIVLGLENWAKDCVTLGKFLNLRTPTLKPAPPPLFGETPYAAPVAPYPAASVSLKNAADLLDHVTDRNDDTVTYLHGQPTATVKPGPPAVKNVPNREERIRLIVHWLATTSGFFKSVLRLYGEEPLPAPPAPHPGPKNEDLQCAEIAAWLSKISKDADSFAIAQKIVPAAGKVPYDTSGEGASFDNSLVRIELALHKVAQDIGAIGSVLPYHLLRAVQ
jgi:hypothetical protein